VSATLRKAFARIDAKTAAAKAASGFQCPPGCGKCCTSPFVEATEIECVPLARALVEQGRASAVLERIRLAESNTCVIYEPTTPDGSKGQCGMYEQRPGLCRLFGFSGRKSDQGMPEWAACSHMREQTAPDMEAALQEPPPACMPIIADEMLALRSNSGRPDEQIPLRINEALGRALSKELTRAMYSSYVRDDDEEGSDGSSGRQPEAPQQNLYDRAYAAAAAAVAASPNADELDEPPPAVAVEKASGTSSFGRPLTETEHRERDRLEGPWQCTSYELYEWLTPLAELTRGCTQDEMVGRTSLASKAGDCLGTAYSVVSGSWPRDEFMKGARRSFVFLPAVPKAELPEGSEPAPEPLVALGAPLELQKESPLELQEIPFEGAGVGHKVWDAAIVSALFLRTPKGGAMLTGATSAATASEPVGQDEHSTGTFPSRPRVLELGAGLGLPGRDLARRGVASSVTLSDSRSALLEQLYQLCAPADAEGSQGTAIDCMQINWHSDADVAEAAAAAYDVVIASDVAYYHPDVMPLAKAIQAIRARVTVVAAPLHRAAAGALGEALEGLGGTVDEQKLTLVSSDTAEWSDGQPPLASRVATMPALAYRVLVVTWAHERHADEQADAGE